MMEILFGICVMRVLPLEERPRRDRVRPPILKLITYLEVPLANRHYQVFCLAEGLSRSRIIQAEEIVVDVPASPGGREEQERLRARGDSLEMRAQNTRETGARVCVCTVCGAPRVWRERAPAKTSTGWYRRRPVRGSDS